MILNLVLLSSVASAGNKNKRYLYGSNYAPTSQWKPIIVGEPNNAHLYDHFIHHLNQPQQLPLKPISPNRNHIFPVNNNYLKFQPSSLFHSSQPLPSYNYNINFGGFPTLSNNHISSSPIDNQYYLNGRIHKQYAVMEHHEEDHDLNQYIHHFRHNTQQNPVPAKSNIVVETHKLPYGPDVQIPYIVHDPYLVANYIPDGIHNDYNNFLQDQQLHYQKYQEPPKKFPYVLNKNHGPIALGSGSLGYITTPNGGISLGSGSLGYISHKQHTETVSQIAARKKQVSVPSPLTFGHGHH